MGDKFPLHSTPGNGGERHAPQGNLSHQLDHIKHFKKFAGIIYPIGTQVALARNRKANADVVGKDKQLRPATVTVQWR